MATPPKIPPLKPVAEKTVAVSAPPRGGAGKPTAKAGTAIGAKRAGPAKAKPVSATAQPYVIEPSALTAFVENSAYAPVPEAGATATPIAVGKPRSAIKATVVTPSAPAAKVPVVTSAKPKPAAVEPALALTKPVEVITPAETPAPVPAADPIRSIDAVQPVEDNVTPTPPQPAVVDTHAAAIETPAAWQLPNVPEGNHIMNEAIETTKKFAEDAKARVQSMMSGINDKAKTAVEKSSKTMEELGDLTKGNLEAFVESSKIAAKGLESLSQGAAEYGRQSFEKSSATFKSFASVKTPAELFKLQSDLLAATFDTIATETAKTSETVLKLAGEIAQPISNRVALVSDKLKSLAA
jgi:phasin family protein